ncbi:transposable element Tcb2 transposase [Trichonephila clavipes]|nr:transposable element Tcb2 transposase [Trichonephila clavipes]
MGAEFLFMDDNTRPHRANIVDECLQSEDITRINWAAYSPDLNPIEHVRKTDLFPEEDTTKSYSEFEPARLQAEGHSHHTVWATIPYT